MASYIMIVYLEQGLFKNKDGSSGTNKQQRLTTEKTEKHA